MKEVHAGHRSKLVLSLVVDETNHALGHGFFLLSLALARHDLLFRNCSHWKAVHDGLRGCVLRSVSQLVCDLKFVDIYSVLPYLSKNFDQVRLRLRLGQRLTSVQMRAVLSLKLLSLSTICLH